MNPLDAWLTELGLANYGKAFAENDIDLGVLPDLTDGDLASLGLSLGHRRKLMAAAARLRVAAEQPPVKPSESSQQVERRQVTVLFTDLVGSTALSTELDPEDMSALLREYQGRCAVAIARHEGFLARYLGDGVLAYFGFPAAHEYDAEHAVRAGLDILREVAQIRRPDGKQLETRVGIATGLVVVGEIIGEGASQEHNIVGETPNLAARLQALAEPGWLVISAATERLVGRFFEHIYLGEHALKGFALPVPAWRTLREQVVVSRFAALRAGESGVLVGRDQELGIALDYWAAARSGAGHAILLSGDAGMGKSRLLEAITESVAREPHRMLRCQCSPYHRNSALYPVIQLLRHAADIRRERSEAQNLAALETFLAERGIAGRRSLLLLAEALGVETQEQISAMEMTKAQRKLESFALLLAFVHGVAGDAPTLFLLEDAHWIDPTTQEFVDRLIPGIDRQRVLAVITHRPEFAAAWAEQPQAASIVCKKLSRENCALLARSIAQPALVAEAIIDEIVARSDGVPLFVEELTKAVVAAKAERSASVPATLQDSLMSRLDRLGRAKDVAQVASVIGREFSLSVLAEIADATAAELAGALGRLIESGLVFRVEAEAEDVFSFNHSLVQEAAYASMLKSRRRALHERIARVLEGNPGVCEEEPELLAHHFRHAGLCDLACMYSERAGDRAAARSSFVEAIAHFDAALAEANKLEAGMERTRRELDLLLKMGPPLCVIKSPQSQEVADLYQRARDHAAALQDDTELFTATWGLWFNTIQGRWLDRARDNAEALVVFAGRTGNDDLMMEGMHCRWATAQFRGELATALTGAHEGMRRYDREKHGRLAQVFGGHDPGVCAHSVCGNMLALAGRPAAEVQYHDGQALSIAEDLRHPGSLAHAAMNSSIAAMLARRYCEADQYAQRLLEIANKHNFPPMRAHAQFVSGWAQAHTGDFSAGMAAMDKVFSPVVSTGPMFRVYAAVFAEGREQEGRFKEALSILESAIATITEPGVGLYISELYRLRGVCLLQAEPAKADEAMHAIRAALDITRRQGASALELRAAMSLAQAEAAGDRSTGGLDSLRELVTKLPPGFESPELAEARRLVPH
jgi:class 3 adenylate cyclase/predicted ATPase/ABC-type transport system involved in cytochrome c biogenesis ATPase subunit